MLAIVLTWLFGTLAVNQTEDKIYHYFFIVFYTFQVRQLTSMCIETFHVYQEGICEKRLSDDIYVCIPSKTLKSANFGN